MDQNENSWLKPKVLDSYWFDFTLFFLVELMNMLIQLWEQSPTSAQKFIRRNIISRGMLLDV